MWSDGQSLGKYNPIQDKSVLKLIIKNKWKVKVFQGSLARWRAQLLISFGGIGLLSMEDCAAFAFLGNWALVVSYLCSRFYIFDRPIWRNMFLKLKGAHTCFNHAYVQHEITFIL
jgi:hypothetical protein